ncbi:T9SS type A sorting domain-containing protein [Tenacibaculum jejuense]|nr:T9SS type A sorting domain-containing protein [Tenacibaculum jejuense]
MTAQNAVLKKSNEPDWNTILAFGGNASETVVELQKDNLGNLYVLGRFYGETTIGDKVLKSEGVNENFFLAQYKTNGDLGWVVQSDSQLNGNVEAFQFKIYNDKIYVLGSYKRGDKLEGTELQDVGENNYVLASYTLSGTLENTVFIGSDASARRRLVSHDYIKPTFTIDPDNNKFYVAIINEIYSVDIDLSRVNFEQFLDINVLTSDITYLNNTILITGIINGTANIGGFVLEDDNAISTIFYAGFNSNFNALYANSVTYPDNNQGISSGAKFTIKNDQLYLFGIEFFTESNLNGLALPRPTTGGYPFIVNIDENTAEVSSLRIFEELSYLNAVQFFNASFIYDENDRLSVLINSRNSASIAHLTFNADGSETITSVADWPRLKIPCYGNNDVLFTSEVNTDNYNLYLSKTENGSEVWENEISGENATSSYVVDVDSDKNNNYYALLRDGRRSNNLFGTSNFTLIKSDLNNNISWSCSLNGSFTTAIKGGEQINYHDGFVYLAGYITQEIEVKGQKITPITNGQNNLVILKISEDGVLSDYEVTAVDATYYNYEDITVLDDEKLLIIIRGSIELKVMLFNPDLTLSTSLDIETKGNNLAISNLSINKGVNGKSYLIGEFEGDELVYNGTVFEKKEADTTSNGRHVIFEIDDNLNVLNVFNYGHTSNYRNYPVNRVKILPHKTNTTYIVGDLSFENQPDFSFNAIGIADFNTSYSDVLYVAKINNDSDFVWVKGISSTSRISSYSSDTDDEGNVYISGTFKEELFITDDVILYEEFENGNESFIIKYNEQGEFQWVKTFSSTGFSVPTSIVTTGHKDQLIVGAFTTNYGVFNSSETFRSEGTTTGVLAVFGDSEVLNLEDFSKEALKIYPNPSTGIFNVNLKGDFTNDKVAVKIYDLNGRIVYNKKTTNSTNTVPFNLSSVTKGVYLVKITDGTNEYLSKVVLK